MNDQTLDVAISPTQPVANDALSPKLAGATISSKEPLVTPEKRKSRLFVIIALVVLVLGGGGGLWYVLTQIKNLDDTQGDFEEENTSVVASVLEDAMIMQTVTPEICKNTPMGTIASLVDARDGNNYNIRKMPDGKCWMVSNLAYAGMGKDTYGDAQVLVFADATKNSEWDESSGVTGKYVTTNNFTGSDKRDRDGNNIQNTNGELGSSGGPQCTSQKTGGWATMRSECLSYLYNWCAAVGLDETTTPTCVKAHQAGFGEGYATEGVIGGSGGVGGESKGDNGSSICPAGWRLPVGRIGLDDNYENEFALLNGYMYAGENNTSPDLKGGPEWAKNWQPVGLFASVSSGIFLPENFGLMDQSAGGFYWASSLGITGHASLMSVDFESVVPGAGSTSKYAGLAVRCVL